MFERFRRDARDAAVGAMQAARQHGDPTVEPDHLLFAALATDSVMARVLARLGADPAAIRGEVAAHLADSRRRTGLDDRDAEALRAIGIDLDEVREQIEGAFGPGALRGDPPRRRRRLLPWRRRCDRDHRAQAGTTRFDPRTKRILELALREAIALRHRHIDTGHLLLAMLRRNPAGDDVRDRLRWHEVTYDTAHAVVVEEHREAS